MKNEFEVYRILDRESNMPCGSYSRACRDEYDFNNVSSARQSNCHGVFEDKIKYKIAKYKVTYELIEDDCDCDNETLLGNISKEIEGLKSKLNRKLSIYNNFYFLENLQIDNTSCKNEILLKENYITEKIIYDCCKIIYVSKGIKTFKDALKYDIDKLSNQLSKDKDLYNKYKEYKMGRCEF